MWGGLTDDRSEDGKKRVQSMLEVFDPYIEVWSQQPTTGTPPPLGLYYSACAAIAASMYICCGFDGSSYYNTLHELGVATRKWRGVLVRNPSEGPMRKTACQMVVYEGKLVLFGGYGIPSHRMQPGASFARIQGLLMDVDGVMSYMSSYQVKVCVLSTSLIHSWHFGFRGSSSTHVHAVSSTDFTPLQPRMLCSN